jgi:predicted nucleic acid-binding protein
MFKRVFLDVNVFIDANDEIRDSKKTALSVLNYLVKTEAKIFTSCDLITTIYYILSKKDKQKALTAIENINKFCTIIEISNKDVTHTCALMRANQKFVDLEDTIQYTLALKEGCDLILSNDKNFVSEEIKLMTTGEFLKII